jgi:hypothetical protein
VDVLIVDEVETSVWEPWITKTKPENLPSMIIVFGESKILSSERDVMGKNFRKQIERYGYQLTFWLMEAWKHGAALNQTRLVTSLRRNERGSFPLRPPVSNELPVRAMSNLLMPTGIPLRARNRCPVNPLSRSKNREPELVSGYVEENMIFDIDGAMPDRIGCWIDHPMGVRCLQHQELAKAKGMLEQYALPVDKGVRNGTRVHLLTAVLDHVSACKRIKQNPEGNKQDDQKKTESRQETTPMWSSDKADQEEDEWDWETPDLSEGAPWYEARLKTLRKAVVTGLSDPEYWYQEGLECL